MRRRWRSVEALECVIDEAKRSSSEFPDDETATASVEAFVKSSVLLGNSVSSSSYSVIRCSASIRRSFGQRKVVSGFVPYAESSGEALLGVVVGASVDFVVGCCRITFSCARVGRHCNHPLLSLRLLYWVIARSQLHGYLRRLPMLVMSSC